jgi:hypothetical protein
MKLSFDATNRHFDVVLSWYAKLRQADISNMAKCYEVGREKFWGDGKFCGL